MTRSASLNWQALHPFAEVLVRRSADRGEWVIGLGSRGRNANPGTRPGTPQVGYLNYEHPGSTDRIASRHPTDPGAWPREGWWEPRHLFHLQEGEVRTHSSDQLAAARIWNELGGPQVIATRPPALQWTRRTSKEDYHQRVERLLQHIQRGDIYEVNYCTERTAHAPDLDPYAAFGRLLAHTDAPFAGFLRRGEQFALCMSPERFLRIEGDQVRTQPMKGTRRRDADPQMDATIALELAADPKERSENIMAVDVARHDLSRIAASRSVRVEELCAVKSYAHVHQLVSTVSARLREGLDRWDAVNAAFPMASMTGAPKLRAMQLIDEVEDRPRGLFSGSLGYILPDGTLDLNVVIRTITYDARSGELSLITGGAITAQSDPEREWEECEVKAESVLRGLG